jgi:hypothetical protein
MEINLFSLFLCIVADCNSRWENISVHSSSFTVISNCRRADCPYRMLLNFGLQSRENKLHATVRWNEDECVSKSFRTGLLERELQMVQLCATRCSCIAILWVSLLSFAAITLCVASQRVFIAVNVYFVMTQSRNFWIHRRTSGSLPHHEDLLGNGGIAPHIPNLSTGWRLGGHQSRSGHDGKWKKSFSLPGIGTRSSSP